MQNYAIGLSGLNAAQTALDLVGNNIANAATDGYHRQRVEFSPSTTGEVEGVTQGAGVDVVGVTRMVDTLLEREIMQQESAYGQVSQELSLLNSVETSFGEFAETGGLNATMDAFFDALQGLSAHPLEQVWRNETISSAESLAAEFRRLGDMLAGLQDQVVLEAQNATESINGLTSQIAELNGQIQRIEIGGKQANNLRDRRDYLIIELSRLVGVEVQEREYGAVDVSIGGLPVVAGAISVNLEAGLSDDRSLEVCAAGSEGYGLRIQGGELGALVSLKNDLLEGFQTDLDTLAKGIIDQVNHYHVQGLGLEGSFQQLTGWAIDGMDLSADMSVTDGAFYVRVTETATGQVARYAVDVDVSADTPESIAARIDAIDGLSASIGSSRLHIVADGGYTFDFLPAVLPEPAATDFTAGSVPVVSASGVYTGDENERFTFTVAGDGSVGNGALRLDVTDAGGDTVGTFNVGAGYAAGDSIDLGNGIRIALSTGELNDGDSFEIEAYASTDTSGFLAAAGMNAFFSGSGASDMRICDEVANSPKRIATALGGDFTDNLAAVRLAAIRDETVESLGAVTPGEYYRRIAADLGQQVSLRQSRQENIEAMVQNLEKHRSDLSSVNINDEAAQLLIFEKMFQAMAKYLNSVQTTMTTLMDIV
jgi:flagellar hook-associated protein 1 FlgK